MGNINFTPQTVINQWKAQFPKNKPPIAVLSKNIQPLFNEFNIPQNGYRFTSILSNDYTYPLSNKLYISRLKKENKIRIIISHKKTYEISDVNENTDILCEDNKRSNYFNVKKEENKWVGYIEEKLESNRYTYTEYGQIYKDYEIDNPIILPLIRSKLLSKVGNDLLEYDRLMEQGKDTINIIKKIKFDLGENNGYDYSANPPHYRFLRIARGMGGLCSEEVVNDSYLMDIYVKLYGHELRV